LQQSLLDGYEEFCGSSKPIIECRRCQVDTKAAKLFGNTFNRETIEHFAGHQKREHASRGHAAGNWLGWNNRRTNIDAAIAG